MLFKIINYKFIFKLKLLNIKGLYISISKVNIILLSNNKLKDIIYVNIKVLL